MFYNEDEPPWDSIEVSEVGGIIKGHHDGLRRVIVCLGGTFYAILEELLIKNEITLEVGLRVEVEYIPSGIGNMRMPEDEQNIEPLAS